MDSSHLQRIQRELSLSLSLSLFQSKDSKELSIRLIRVRVFLKLISLSLSLSLSGGAMVLISADRNMFSTSCHGLQTFGKASKELCICLIRFRVF